MADVEARKSELKTGGDIVALLRDEITTRPGAMLKLFLMKIGRSWYGTDSRRKEWLVLLLQLAYLLPATWAATRVWRMGGINRRFLIGSLLLVGYFWGMTILALSIARYMVPVMGLLFVVLAGGLCRRERPDKSHVC
jgi:hypothetical protein